jgi:hypothetical protein
MIAVDIKNSLTSRNHFSSEQTVVKPPRAFGTYSSPAKACHYFKSFYESILIRKEVILGLAQFFNTF